MVVVVVEVEMEVELQVELMVVEVVVEMEVEVEVEMDMEMVMETQTEMVVETEKEKKTEISKDGHSYPDSFPLNNDNASVLDYQPGFFSLCVKPFISIRCGVGIACIKKNNSGFKAL